MQTKTIPVTITLPAGTKRKLYVNVKRAKLNAMLRAESKDAPQYPEIIVRSDDPHNGVTITHCDEVAALGVFRFKSSKSNGGPLTPEGPALWVETEAELELTIL